MDTTDDKERKSSFWGFLSGLRFPQLFVLFALLLVADLAVPDIIPFLDEAILGVLTLMLGRWKKRGGEVEDGKPPEKNVTPQD